MDSIVFDRVSKIFRHRPALFNWFGHERAGQAFALRDVSFSLPAGKVLVLLGRNGSGKTTTLKLISTALLADSGRVVVSGSDTRRDGSTVRKLAGFAVSSERPFIARLTARENLDFFAALDEVPRRWRRERIQQLLEHTALADAADTLVMKFSAGMYQRLAITRALLKLPPVLLLDEPGRSLDPEGAANIRALIQDLRNDGRTIVLATHNLDEAVELGDFVAVLECGRLAAFNGMRGRKVEDLRSVYFQSAANEMDLPLAARSVS